MILLKIKSNKIMKYIDSISKNKNSIKIVYKNDNNPIGIKIFGEEFVSKNKNNCKIIYDNKTYDLESRFNIKSNKIIEIELIGIINITNMEKMFYNCSNLISLPDINLIDTTKINNMSYMFYKCSSLSSLPDISNWNTSNVLNMSYMFYYCSSLSKLPDISKWNTDNFTDMNNMFKGCKPFSLLIKKIFSLLFKIIKYIIV